MLKYSTGRGKPGWGKESCKPIWWPEDIPWANVRSDVRTEEQKQRVGVSLSAPNGAQGAAGWVLAVVFALRDRRKGLCHGLLKEGRDAVLFRAAGKLCASRKESWMCSGARENERTR